MNLLLMGTGNLLPGSVVWESLAECNIRFAEYNAWCQILLDSTNIEKDTDLIVWVLNLDDIFPKSLFTMIMSENNRNNKTLEDEIERQTAPLRAFLESNKQLRIVVAWLLHKPSTAIQYARQNPLFFRLNQLWEERLRLLQKEHEGLFLLPLYHLFAREGMKHCLDARNFYAADCRFSFQGLKIIARNIARLIGRIENAPRKILALDCDNTLWGGVVGEDGLDGLQLGEDGMGKAFLNFQEAVTDLSKDGVLLSILSKNNEEDVWQVFEQHPGMYLRRQDIVASRINWREKAINLQELADELSLGIDSFVFWDDNPLEREKMRSQLPDVFVPDVPEKVWEWETALRELTEFHKFSITEEDRQKQIQYKARGNFKREQSNSLNVTDFMHSLELMPRAVPITPPLLPRSEQLCAKTNQFNLSTRRHDRNTLEFMAHDPGHEVFLVHLRDRFGEHGNVGMVIAQLYPNKQTAILNTFLMSCRIMGRHLEAWMLAHLKGLLEKVSIRYLLVEYIKSSRNDMVREFIESLDLKFLRNPTDFNGLPLAEFQVAPEGILYCADLEKIKIPYQEFFRDET